MSMFAYIFCCAYKVGIRVYIYKNMVIPSIIMPWQIGEKINFPT